MKDRQIVDDISVIVLGGQTTDQDQFDLIRVFPSHTAHVHTGPGDSVFVADPDCDGIV